MRLNRPRTIATLFYGMTLLWALGAQAGQGAGPYYSSPSWDQKLKCDKGPKGSCPRFVVLSNWGGEAVLDKETGLVWERSPNKQTFPWGEAQVHCNNLDVGNRKGWRLPMIQELASLVDTSQTNPSLPSGHPFQNVQMGYYYWSVSNVIGEPNAMWMVEFHEGKVIYHEKTAKIYAWCVRGETGYPQ